MDVIEPNAYGGTATPSEPQQALPNVENPKPPTPGVDKPKLSMPGVASVLQRWTREDLLEKGRLVLISLACFFSLLSLIIMASNRHGYRMEFSLYQEFRYVVAVGTIGLLYSLVQVVLQLIQLNKGGCRHLSSTRTCAIVNFAGDQVMSYLLLSAMSSAAPTINRMRLVNDNIFTDSLAASVTMAFFAFAAMALSSLNSGYRLSRQGCI